ncbi:MAG: TrgA family protein [Rhodobacter sp.]|nr:TrgA family protein [Rhodobacter sp.]
MPTMPKLIAAVLVAVLGYFAADVVAAHLPPETRHGMLRPMSVFFGLLIGWRFLGRRVGGGVRSGIGLGLSASVILLLVSMTFWAGTEMVHRALRKTYGGNPFEALQDMVQIALDFKEHLAYPDVVIVLVVGGIVVGALVEAAGRRWS